MRNVEVRKSEISGKGVYSIRDMKTDEVVFMVRGHIHTFHPHDDSWNLQNAVGYAKNKWINPYPSNPLRYTNHSCNPNCILGKGLKVIALHNIKKGEEITINYSLTEGDVKSEMGVCRCKAKNCKKKIGTIHSVSKKEFLKYKKYLPRWIIEEYEQVRKEKMLLR